MREPADNPIASHDESHERDLNRHRATEQRRTRVGMVDRLADRGIMVSEADALESVVELLDAVETFERTVEARGGDLMVDTPPSRQPDSPQFVLPRREAGEPIDRYAGRIRAAASRLRASRAD